MTSETHPSNSRPAVTPERRVGAWATVGAAVVFVAFVVAATVGTMRSNAGQRDIALRSRTNGVLTSIDDRLAAYEEVLYGIRGGFGVKPDLDRRSFSELVDGFQVDDRLPGVQVIGAAHLVDKDQLDDWESRIDELARASGIPYPTFEVNPPTELDQALAIDYIEPLAGNERAFGLDFFSEPNRRAAALRARDSGQSSATAPVTLVQESGTQRAFLVMLPIYRKDAPTETLEERRAAFDGVVYAAFRMGDLMGAALGDDPPSDVSVIDVASGEALAGDIAGATDASDSSVGQFEISGRTWQVVVADDEPVLSAIERTVPFATLFGGLLVAGLMVALIASMRSSRSRAVALATEMTGELEALTESASEGIISVGEDGLIVAWNSGATRIFGPPAPQMLGGEIRDLVPQRVRDDFDAAFSAVVSGSDPSRVGRSTMTTGRRADGSEFPAEVSLSKWSARGRTFVTGFVRDVTDRVEAEIRLTETSNLLLGVLGAATELSIIATDTEGEVTVFNAGAEQMLGYDSADVVGLMSAGQFHDPEEVAARAEEVGVEPGFEVFVAAAREGTAETRQWTYVRADGKRLPVELTVTPRYDGSGTVCGFIGVAIDITKRVAAAEQQQLLLEQEREMVAKLTELDRVKNDFVSTMSHELRTPLTSIIGYAELLADGASSTPPPPHAGMIDTIQENAQRLLLLVEDLLALSKIESGSLRATREPCDMARIITATNEAVAPLADKNHVAVNLQIGELPMVNGDAPQLERVCLNLLTNAIKFSHPGGTVDISAEGTSDAVTIVFADQGIGIPEDERQHLFSRFFRSRTAEKNAIQGTGLGLSIVANIVRRHGGTVEIESVENVGTTVTVRLPTDGLEHSDLAVAPATASTNMDTDTNMNTTTTTTTEALA